MSSNPPFARGSVSIRLYPHLELDAEAVVSELCAQARLALAHGFDGVMVSEHHGGFSGYLPNPLQIATFILDETSFGWAAPCPLLLPLRPTALVAEEIAWLAARHPGRVGLGVAVGSLRLDFSALGLRLEDALARFRSELPRIVGMLRGEQLGEIAGDRALQRCKQRPIPVLSAAASVPAARRAARAGAGILLESMSSAAHRAAICAAYDALGGREPKVLICRLCLGGLAAELIARQRMVYESYARPGAQHGWPADQTLASTDPHQLAERLRDEAVQVGATAVNLRLHLPGMEPSRVRDEIVGIGEEVLPVFRKLWRPAAGESA